MNRTAAYDRARRLRRELAFLLQLRVLPPRIALFQWRARRLALRIGDDFSRISATRPGKLSALLSLAEDRQRVVELGTASGWTAISLLMTDPMRSVVSYDIHHRPELDRYLELAGPEVRRRLEFVCAPGREGPRGNGDVDLLYIDSSHERAGTIAEVQAWKAALRDRAVIVFDDYGHPEYPGVRQAVEDLGLDGEECQGLFVHRVSRSAACSPLHPSGWTHLHGS